MRKQMKQSIDEFIMIRQPGAVPGFQEWEIQNFSFFPSLP